MRNTVNQTRKTARALTVNGAVQFDFRLDAVALRTQIDGRCSLDVAGDDTLDVDPSAEKAAPMSAGCFAIFKRCEAARHLAIELVGESARAEAQHCRNFGLDDERSVVLIRAEWRLFQREGRIDRRNRHNGANDTKTALHARSSTRGTHRRHLIELRMRQGGKDSSGIDGFPA